MRTQLLFILAGILSLLAVPFGLRADVLEMQNGDRYSGKVLSVSTDTVVLNSEILGKINVPRGKVATLIIGAPATPKPVVRISTNQLIATSQSVLPNGDSDLAAMFRQMGSNTNFIGQVRQQMLAGRPEAAGKFDEMVNGLMSGQISMDDLRRQAQSSAQQLRELKSQLGPEADDALDSYLKILDAFINETPAAPANKSN